MSLGVIESLRLARPDAKFLELAHRLDRETSGLLVCAKKRVALVALQAQFRERATQKTYQAVVFGKVPKREKTVRLALSRDAESSSGDRRVRVDPNGLSAVSIVKGLEQVKALESVAQPGMGQPGSAPLEGWLSRVQVEIENRANASNPSAFGQPWFSHYW